MRDEGIEGNDFQTACAVTIEECGQDGGGAMPVVLNPMLRHGDQLPERQIIREKA